MIRTIIADDHAMFRQGLITLLTGESDIEIVAHCANGVEALAAVKAYKPDVAVLDITMPKMDGIAAARCIKLENPSTRIVILTMHDDITVQQQARAAGADAFVLKDDAFEQLLLNIRALVNPNKILPFTSTSPISIFEELTEREQQVMRLVATGFTNRSISEHLGISIKTVDTHRTNLMRKLNIHSIAELVRYAITTGII